MSATLRLTREGLGIELRGGVFDVAVDGEPVGKIERRETIELPVEPGRHTVRLRSGRYSSRTRSFEASEGEVVRFRCHGAMVWLRYFGSLLKPDIGIRVTRE